MPYSKTRKRVPRRRVHKRYRASKTFKRQVRHELIRFNEKKYHAVEDQDTSTNAGTVISMTDIPQSTGVTGATDVTRTGDQVTVTSINMRFWWRVGSVLPSSQIVRLIVFQWFPPTVPTLPSILINSINTVVAPYAHDTRFNFKILYDATSMLSIDWHAVQFRRFMLTKKFKPKIQYQAGGLTGTNKIYFLFCSDNAVSLPSIQYLYKINFRDS